jgi:hypothetical protein
MFGMQLAQATGATAIQPQYGNGGFSMEAGTVTYPRYKGYESDSEFDSEIESSSGRGKHEYRPLKANEIRLLVLNPGAPDEPIECYLEHYNVNQAKAYQALSYVWGSTQDPGAIQVDGSDFTVTRSLMDFFTSFRSEYDCFVLWIDAICINQNDVAERNAQIRLMKRVYEGADSITIWLGNEEPNTLAAIQCAESLYFNIWSPRLAKEGSPERALSSFTSQDVHSLIQDSQQLGRDRWEGLSDLLARPWWSRIWVYQEATAPAKNGSRVVCGRISSPFDILLTVNKLLFTFTKLAQSQQPPDEGLTRLGIRTSATGLFIDLYTQLRREYLKNGTSNFLTMSDLLPTLRQCASTNPRDKLYALIPTSLDGADLVDVDYTLSVEDVYTNAALSFLQKHQNLDILGHCTAPEQDTILKLPSWVPDWTAKSVPTHFFKRRQDHAFDGEGRRLDGTVELGKLYNASAGTLVDVQHDETRRKLFCRGFTFDSVKMICPTSGDEHEPGRMERECSRWLEDANFTQPKALSRTLIADSYRVGVDVAARGPHTQVHATDTELEQNLGGLELSVGIAGPHQASLGRRLFLTDKGYLGLTLKHVQIGDVVAILSGGQLPFVLRKVQGHYTLIGEAYVDGIMDGEAVELHKSAGENGTGELFELW